MAIIAASFDHYCLKFSKFMFACVPPKITVLIGNGFFLSFLNFIEEIFNLFNIYKHLAVEKCFAQIINRIIVFGCGKKWWRGLEKQTQIYIQKYHYVHKYTYMRLCIAISYIFAIFELSRKQKMQKIIRKTINCVIKVKRNVSYADDVLGCRIACNEYSQKLILHAKKKQIFKKYMWLRAVFFHI